MVSSCSEGYVHCSVPEPQCKINSRIDTVTYLSMMSGRQCGKGWDSKLVFASALHRSIGGCLWEVAVRVK